MASWNVGTAGRLEITDDGSVVRFYVHCSDSRTNTNYSWYGTVNGVGVGGTVRLNAGFGSMLLGAWGASYSQNVSLGQNATGTGGLGGAAGPFSAYIGRATVPPAPLMRDPSMITTNGMRVNFDSQGDGGSGILRWELQRSRNSAFTDNVNTYWSNGVTVFDDMQRREWGFFRARGVNALGAGPWSNITGAQTFDIPDTAPQPTLVSKTNTSIQYNVSNPSYLGPSPYERTVQISPLQDFSSGVQQHVEPAQTSTFTGLTRATPYYLRQKIKNALGDANPVWSPVLSVETPGTVPSAPTGYASYDVTATSARVGGAAIADNGGRAPSNSRVQYNTSPTDVGSTSRESGYWGGNDITGLTKGTTYHYRIAAYNNVEGGGWGPYGAWQSFTTKPNVPSAPTGLAASSITNGTANLSWALPSALNGAILQSIQLRVGSNPSLGTDQQNFSFAPNVTNQALGGLKPNTTYYAQVWSQSNNGLGSASPIISFTTTGGSGGVKPEWIKVNGVWKKVTQVWIKVNGVWKPVTTSWQKRGGVWRAQ